MTALPSLFLTAVLAASSNGGGPPRFTDVTEAAGIDFVHENGASGRRYMVEIAGGGVLVLDFDGDGRPDLYFVNGAPLPGDSDGTSSETSVLYRNLGGGRFEDVTVKAGVASRGYGMGGAAADVDNDGDVDLLVTAFGDDQLFRNNGDGTFSEAPPGDGISDPGWSTSAAFFDADADGFLDAYVSNYLDFTLENHRECVSPAKGIPSYCHPQEYDGVRDVFFRNRGDGTFEEATEAFGFDASRGGKGLGVVVSDYDDDGDPDVYVANDTTPNFLFRNEGGGHFREVGFDSGVAYNEEGLPEAGMGTDWGDFDRDGRLDLVVTNFDFETNTLYRNLGDGFFFDATAASGLGSESLTELAFGCELEDFDDDGWLDLVVTNGHILDNISEIQSNLRFAQPAQLFWNRGGTFENASATAGEALARDRVGRGLASLDFDGDGDRDLVLASNGGRAELLRNDTESRGRALSLRFVGRESSRDGVGVRVEGRLAAGVLVEEVRAGASYLAQSETALHLGLGDRDVLEGAVVRWPSGREEELPPLAAGRRYVVKEGVGVVGSEPTPR